ncbi:MAG TPA: type II toxin-antitoxin system RelE/ParE family toxin [Lacibacter sp.]|nr:type II toxin-antitoxin system RelE/ParE family toxin [Lacibacter sp.]HMO89552.1 type II toxin-antitoxin system RelE/ParE family toxin [Lacibacter sp.]HMP86187.1 type II toxin-antitoxin system RelE/ParE family toxin [Lacibacter sp.]
MKKNESTWSLEDWLLLFGGVWLISRLFKTSTKAGIGALPEAQRFLYSYHNKAGKNVLETDMSGLSVQQQGEIVRLIIQGRLKPVLSLPLYKKFKDPLIDGELRDNANGWRIFCCRVNTTDYLMVSVFKKQSNKTPDYETEKARARIKEWLTHKTLVRKSSAR